MNMPRPEHPNPIFERENWINLNGEWDFEFDFGKSGIDRKMYENGNFSKKIIVPFCPESKLSGIGYTDFIDAVWYRRIFSVPEKFKSERCIIHFGAVDFKALVYVNGMLVTEHEGGYTSFEADITKYLSAGENTVVVYAQDDTRSGLQASGKQSPKHDSWGCYYTRTTGIWQTVWLEFVPQKAYIKNVKYYPDAENGKLAITAEVFGKGEFTAKSSFCGKPCGEVKVKSHGGALTAEIQLSEIHLWHTGEGNLYDLELSYGEDCVRSYFGLRSVRMEDMKFLLNGKSVFQRLVLDQGFYPEGIYTAPSDEALKNDIQLSLNMGFNGARLHEKIFEPRFLYHCDKMGYLVWGEHANWGIDYNDPKALAAYLNEWRSAVNRDFNHPSIIGWCPFNETYANGSIVHDKLLSEIYYETKNMDSTRPCIDTSGYTHIVTDIYDVHDYEQNPEIFKKHYESLEKDGTVKETGWVYEFEKKESHRQNYKGEPFFVSEYGGIRWDFDGASEGWGYGDAPKSKEEFIERYRGLTTALLENSKMFGFCYTQLYDVEQEINGLYTYDRRAKFDPAVISAINRQKAAIETM